MNCVPKSSRVGRKMLSLLGLCFRAGKLISGDDAVADMVSAGEARLLVLADNAGANITRRVQRYEQEKGVPVVRLKDSAQELGWALGRKPTAICCITDIGFAAAAAKKAAETDAQYEPLAQQLESKKVRILSRRGRKKPHKKSARNQSSGGRKESTYVKRGGERA